MRLVHWHLEEGGDLAMPKITMPRLSDTMEEGTIARWLKHPGDKVNKGDILGEIETDKATMDLESYDAGVLEQILLQEGETVPIGQPIALIGTGEGTAAAPNAAPPTASATSTPAAPAPNAPTTAPTDTATSAATSDGGANITASPPARR